MAGIAAIVVSGKWILPHFANASVVPNGMYVQGIIVGLLSALLAIGLVLIYRTNRIINFAQGSLGAVAATLASQLFLILNVPYVIAVITGIVAGVGVSLLVEFAVIRRFRNAPRLILTVATIGIAQLLTLVELLPNILHKHKQKAQIHIKLESPFTFHFTFGGVRFTADHLIVLIGAPLILLGLAYFFARTRYGIAARATAENEERARLLGCRVKRVSFIIWGLAGLLSALTAVLRAPILGFQLGQSSGADLLLRALAPAILARMESLPITVLAAVTLTIGEQSVLYAFGRTGYTDAFYLVVIVGALLLQRERFGRVDKALSSWRSVQEIRPTPRELSRVREVRLGRWGLFGLLGAVVLTLPLYLSAANTNLASVILIYAMVGISLVVLTGWSGNVSLGQWAIVGIGAYVGAKMATAAAPTDFFVILLVSGVCGALVALVIGLPALRIRGLFLAVTTLAFALAAENWIFQWNFFSIDKSILRPAIFGIWDTTTEKAFFYVSVAGLAFALWVARNLRRSRWGRNLIAIRDNETQAQSMGMRLIAAKLGAFAVSGFIAGLAGCLYAYNQQALRFDVFTPETSLLMFSMVVIGGMGSLTGALLGAVYVRGIQYFLPADLQLFATGFGLLILLLVFPGGLGQVFYQLRDRVLRIVAERKNIMVPSLFADKRIDEPIPELAEAHAMSSKQQQTAERKARAAVLAETKRS